MQFPQHGDDHDRYGPRANTPLNELAATLSDALGILDKLGLSANEAFVQRFGHLTPWQISKMIPGIPEDKLHLLDRAPVKPIDD